MIFSAFKFVGTVQILPEPTVTFNRESFVGHPNSLQLGLTLNTVKVHPRHTKGQPDKVNLEIAQDVFGLNQLTSHMKMS